MMINIEPCCSDTEPVCRGEGVNNQVVDFLSGIIKRKLKKQDDNNISECFFNQCQYDNKYYHGNILFSVPEVKNRDCHDPGNYDITLMYSSPDKTKDTVFKNDISQYIVCKNTIAEPSDVPIDTHAPDNTTQDNTTQDNTIEPEETGNMPAEKEYYPGTDCGDTNSIPEQGIAATLPEQPVFINHPLSGVIPERENHSLRHYEPEKAAQEKTSQTVYHSGKNQLSPEFSRPDYYCSYHFRQKYQPPEPVYIYRDNPGVFKLETYSESLKRRLKSAVNINGIDDIDII
ncbi:hypothetical protein PQM29_002014 [Morganella morganii]|nr:hypothetical protein [Morganella morganii]